MTIKLALLLTAGMTAAFLTGCGGSKTPVGSAPTAGIVQEQKTTAAEAEAAADTDSVADTDAPSDADADAPSAQTTYTIVVQDAEDSTPLSGARVQFCSDIQCMVSTTDANGTATFEADPGNYTAHVLEAPDGYEAAADEITLTEDTRTAAFALQRSGAAASGN